MPFLAATLRLSSNLVSFRLLMPLLAVIFVKTLLWLLVVLATRRLVLRYRASWAELAYPVLWGAVNTLMAALLPYGNWGSPAYSQADNLAVLQVAALAGLPGLLFMLCLARSTGAWITLGIGVQDAAGRRNLAWLFSPDGTAPVSYQKHHLAPPERDFLAGSAYAVQPVADMAMGLAICKDMHFAPLG
jgi:apolipoprotein N-acyltransferase